MKLVECIASAHDWMQCGSTEVCVICGQSRARKDLPAWKFDKRGVIDKGKKKRPRT